MSDAGENGVSVGKREAITAVLIWGKRYGYGHIIAHLKAAWIKSLIAHGSSEASAIMGADTSALGYPAHVGSPEQVDVCLVIMNDWDGLYIDGELAVEDNTLYAMSAIKALADRCHLVVSSKDQETVDEPLFVGDLPRKLVDLETELAQLESERPRGA